jgi:hypothetical protein
MSGDRTRDEWEVDLQQPGLQGRHRNKDGEISRKHGNTLVSTLRKIYGPSFAQDFAPHATLSDVLAATGDRSLSEFHRDQLHRDHDDGVLEGKIARHEGGAIEKEVAEDQARIDKGAP